MINPTKAVYISGATGFLGRNLTAQLLNLGYPVVLGGRNFSELKNLRIELSTNYKSLVWGVIPCDLADPEKWNDALVSLEKYPILAYVNCSGIQGRIARTSELTQDDFKIVFDVNLFSSIFFTKYFVLKHSKENPISVVHFSGGGATSSRPFFVPYSISKTALVRFIENVAAENSTSGFKINAVAPGVLPSKMQSQILETPLLANSSEEHTAIVSFKDSQHQILLALDLIEFLISKQSDGISGKIISARWDNWTEWPQHLNELNLGDLYTLRRHTARDEDLTWGDV
jgi:3-oxoacyl-[acyl-carrier protein] reductase